MMKNNNSHINSSKENFKDFFDGNMDEQQRNSFTHEAEKDELTNEAFKGFASDPSAIKDIDQIDQIIKTKYTNNPISFKIKMVSFISISVFVIIISIYFLTFHNKTSFPVNKQSHIATVSLDSNEFNVIKKKIDKAELIPVAEQITSLKTKSEQIQVHNFEKDMPIELLTKLRINGINHNTQQTITNISDITYKYMPVDYNYELKVVDYTKIYRTKIKINLSENGSLSPKYENYQSISDTLKVDNSSSIPYTDFLEDAMGKFSTNSFKEALQDYLVILRHFPDDQNAHFYGGLCYYNIGLYDHATNYFDEILKGNIATFIQEAMWYKALSLNNSGNIEEAEILFKKIIEAKGFYSDQAKELIQE